jgi:hypothetical protein
MTDWIAVGFSALWIIGLGLVTSGLSFSYYQMDKLNKRLRQVIELPGYRFVLNLGLLFFCLGWLGLAGTILERVVWAILSIFIVIRIWQGRKLGTR